MKKALQGAKTLKGSKNYRTLMATLITHLNSISVGMCQGYSAVLLPQLKNHAFGDDRLGTVPITSDEASWIASLGVLTNPIGALLSGILLDVCGRKRAICYTTLPFICGWAMIGTSNDLFSLYLGRCITGLAIGMASSSYVYVAEISTPSSRGFLSAVGPVFVSLGVLIVYCLGYVTGWKIIALICTITAFFTFLTTLLLPESPSWLVTNGSLGEASKALLWFRKDHAIASLELADILESAKISRNSKPRSLKEMFFYCKRAPVWKPFVILVIFFALQELTGLYVVLYYAVNFFEEIGAFFDEFLASILVGSIRFVVSIIGAVCIQNFTRKMMATSSGVFMALSMTVIAIYMHLFSSFNLSQRPVTWLPLVSMLINVAASMLGTLQLPWMMIAELFPMAVRGLMGGIVSSLAYLFVFITIKYYPAMMHFLHIDGSLMLFAVASAFMALFSVFFLPETKDKSLFEIEKAFNKTNAGESKENLPSSIVTQNVPTVSITVEIKNENLMASQT